MTEWQPIETAPDGKIVLFWLDWADDCAPLNPPLPLNEHRVFRGAKSCWTSTYKATHWQPLPSPPDLVLKE